MSNFIFELLGSDGSVDSFTIFVEDTVRTHFVPFLGSGSRVEVYAKQSGEHEKDQTKLKLNSNSEASGPKEKIHNP